MDRPSRAALQSLNDQLARWQLPTLKGLPRAPAGEDPYCFTIRRALIARNMLAEHAPDLGAAFQASIGGYQYWGREGMLHVSKPYSEALVEFVVRHRLGEYPTLRA